MINSVKSTARAGFTLIELMVVVAILGVLGTVATVQVKERIEDGKKTAAQLGVDTLSEGVMTYYIKNKKMPQTLDQLIEGTDDNPPILKGGETALEDPWKSKYDYKIKGRRYMVWSYGPNMTDENGEGDDISDSKK